LSKKAKCRHWPKKQPREKLLSKNPVFRRADPTAELESAGENHGHNIERELAKDDVSEQFSRCQNGE